MTDDSPIAWSRVKRILADALEVAPAGRDAFVAGACAEDEALRLEVEALLVEHEGRGPLDEVGDELRALVGDSGGPGPGDRIGRFRVVREIGRGGMGTVYLAEREDADFEQRVAIKVVAGGLAGAGLAQRLRAERRILARLDHPGIARFLDGDVTPEGRHYLVMEHVDGVPIDDFADAARLDVDARLRLFRSVLDAVQCAHQHLVVHQDIKPSNILVREDGTVKLLDFGIAKLVADGVAAPGPVMGAHTPGYASPEQTRGEPATLASDVYALGVLLHVLLTGVRPVRAEGGPASTAPITEGAAAARATTERRLRARLTGDLDSIVARALAPDPADRYATAERLDNDLRAYAEVRPVGARPDGWRYRSAKFVRRNRLALGAAAAVLVALVGGLFATARQARLAEEAARAAAAERDLSRQVSELLVGMFELSDPAVTLGETITAREILDRAAEGVDGTLAGQPAAQARILHEIGRLYRNLGLDGPALATAERALAIERRLPGYPTLEAAETLRLAGGLLAARGDRKGATDLLQEALDPQRRALPGTRLAVAATLNELANVLRFDTRFEEAEAAWGEALDLVRAGPDPDGLTGEILYGLALARHDQGDFAAAEERFRDAIEHLPVDGPHGQATPFGAESRQRLGQLLTVRRQFDEAEALLREALAIQDRLLEPGHTDRVSTLRSLATLLVNTDRRAEAVPLLEEALEQEVRSLGPDHFAVASTRYMLGTALVPLGREPEAVPLLRDAVAVDLRTYGPTHPYLVNAAYSLSLAQLATGDVAGAAESARLSYEAVRANYAEDHPFFIQATALLGRVEAARGRPDSAVVLLRDAVDRGSRGSGRDDRMVVVAQVALGAVLVDLARAAEAEQILRPAVEASARLGGPGSPLLADAEFALGRALAALGRRDEAAARLGSALRSRQASRPPGHASIEEVHAALGRLGSG